jgi:hypothetical protein
VPDHAERRCVLFGCLEKAAWIVSDPKAASCNDALGRVSLDSSVRVEVSRA